MPGGNRISGRADPANPFEANLLFSHYRCLHFRPRPCLYYRPVPFLSPPRTGRQVQLELKNLATNISGRFAGDESV